MYLIQTYFVRSLLWEMIRHYKVEEKHLSYMNIIIACYTACFKIKICMNKGYKLNELLIFPSNLKAFIYMYSVIHTLHKDYKIYPFALFVWFPNLDGIVFILYFIDKNDLLLKLEK